jgi:hypothetical protein
MFLFKVEDKFMITGRGLVLIPGIGDKKAGTGDKIKIIRPDSSVISAKIKGIAFNQNRDISVGTELSKEDVPIGSEVWLDE